MDGDQLPLVGIDNFGNPTDSWVNIAHIDYIPDPYFRMYVMCVNFSSQHFPPSGTQVVYHSHNGVDWVRTDPKNIAAFLSTADRFAIGHDADRAWIAARSNHATSQFRVQGIDLATNRFETGYNTGIPYYDTSSFFTSNHVFYITGRADGSQVLLHRGVTDNPEPVSGAFDSVAYSVGSGTSWTTTQYWEDAIISILLGAVKNPVNDDVHIFYGRYESAAGEEMKLYTRILHADNTLSSPVLIEAGIEDFSVNYYHLKGVLCAGCISASGKIGFAWAWRNTSRFDSSLWGELHAGISADGGASWDVDVVSADAGVSPCQSNNDNMYGIGCYGTDRKSTRLNSSHRL